MTVSPKIQPRVGCKLSATVSTAAVDLQRHYPLLVEMWKYRLTALQPVILAVDAGATKTEAVVFDGEIVGAGVRGPGNYHSVGLKAASENVSLAVMEAFARTGCAWKDIDHALYGIAGADSSSASRQKVGDMVKGLHGQGHVKLYNDGIAAYQLATLGRSGVVAAAGTGSVIQGRNGARRVRVGGWGWFIGDEGSAFYIGRKGLQKATQSFDGREDETSLIDAFAKEIGAEFPEVVSRFQEEPSINSVAALAPLVTGEAGKGDRIATEICREAGLDLASGVQSARKKLGLTGDYIIGAVGGVFRGGSVITTPFYTALADAGGRFAPAYFGYHAVIGSILIHLGDQGAELSEKLAGKLVSQLEGRIKQLGREERLKYLFLR